VFFPSKIFYFRTPPRASQLAVPGSIVVVPVSTAPGYLNLSLLWPQGLDLTPDGAAASSVYNDQVNGVQGYRIGIYADGADIGIITGRVAADVTGGNAPVLATAGSVTAGVYTGAAGACWRLVNGATQFEVIPTIFQDVILGYVGSASGNMRLFQISGSMGAGVG
jgi:hypothetical protein